jgi:hypothetical protein
MPTSPNRIPKLGEYCMLIADFRRGESVLIPAKSRIQIPTAESLAFAEMNVGRMWWSWEKTKMR